MAGLRYRPDLDGLRAVAILLVLAYHVFPRYAPGGFVGVDVFFVISGYLITGTILKNLEAGEFSFLDFYARRFRRIVPALLVVLCASLLAARFLLLADEFRGLGRHVLAAAAFFPNVLLAREAGYFDAPAAFKPLLHLWSIGVEEQFYLVWPPLLTLCWRRRHGLAALLCVLGAASFAYNVSHVSAQQARVFYLLPGRFWELLVGCALAHAERRNPEALPRRLADLMAAAAAGLLVAAVRDAHAAADFPGWRALLPVAAAALLVSAGPDSWINRRLLSLKPAVAIGLISYSLYLWHYPLLVFAHTANMFDVDTPIRLALVAAAFLAAWLTWRFVEVPARERLFAGMPRSRRGALSVGTGLAALAALGAVGFMFSRGLLYSKIQRESEAFGDWSRLASARFMSEGRYGLCMNSEEVSARYAPECYTPAGAVSVWLWGDSHAAGYYSSLRAFLNPSISLLQTTGAGCPPLLDEHSPVQSAKCRADDEFVLRQAGLVKPAVMILAGLWSPYAAVDDGFLKSLDDTLLKLKAQGIGKIVVVGPVPVWTAPLGTIALREYLLRGRPFPPRTDRRLYRDAQTLDARMQKHFEGAGIVYVPIAGRLCDAGGCMTMVGDKLPEDLITWDNAHLSRPGADYLVRNFIGPAVAGLLKSASRARR